MSAASRNTIAEKQCEALKALADWSKWLISLESALIVARIALATDHPISRIAVWAFFCFALSILAAAWLLGAVPGAIEQIPICDKEKPNIYAYRQFQDFAIGIPIWIFALSEHLFFAVGLILFVLSFAWSSREASVTCIV